MHILFLSDNFYPEVNAAASRVYERAIYWVKAGHSVTMITCAPNFPQGKIYEGYENLWHQEETIEGIRVIRVKTFIAPNKKVFLRSLDFSSYMIMAIIEGAQVKSPDVIVATSPQFLTVVAGWIVSLIKQKPFVFELSDLWPASVSAVFSLKRGIFYRCVEQVELFFYRRASKIVALTNAFKKDLVSRGIPEEKIEVILNGVEIDKFSARAKDVELEKEYRLSGKFVVGYVGTHGMAHGLNNLVRTADILHNNENIQFILVGDGAERNELIRFAESRQLKNITFIPAQPKSEIARYWSLCDVALVHLKDDSVFSTVIPSKIFEAMAMGLPVIYAGPRGEASELIQQEQVGISVPAENPEALSQTIEGLYLDRALRDDLAQKSLIAASKHTRKAQAEAMLSVITHV